MNKKLKINTGLAILINDKSDAFNGYTSISINTGKAIVSRILHEKLMQAGVSINCGNMDIIDVSGEIVELSDRTVITEKTSYKDCYLFCDGKLIIESTEGISSVTGIYATAVYYPQSVDLNVIKNISTSKRINYPDDAILYLDSMILNDESAMTLSTGLYWVDAKITALENDALEKLHSKGTTFNCNKLIIKTGLYEKYNDMFKANKLILIPDDHAFIGDTELDSATNVLNGDKLFILGDLTIANNQTHNLQDFTSIIVKGTVTMPISAVKEFKARGKADEYDLHEGTLMTINGNGTITHEQLKKALETDTVYTLNVNGIVVFTEDVTAEDIEAIAAINCNGILYASGNARSAIDTKVRSMNGEILDISDYYNRNKEKAESISNNNETTTKINTGKYKM